jgi:hypothetical protein
VCYCLLGATGHPTSLRQSSHGEGMNNDYLHAKQARQHNMRETALHLPAQLHVGSHTRQRGHFPLLLATHGDVSNHMTAEAGSTLHAAGATVQTASSLTKGQRRQTGGHTLH